MNILKNIKNSNIRVLVIGDFMIDQYFWGETNRVSPEAPVPIVNIKRESLSLGGAGNVVNNLVSFGAKVEVLSVIGDDKESKELLKLLEKTDVNFLNIIKSNTRKTTKKSRLVSSNQQMIRFDNENSLNLSTDDESKLIRKFKEIISKVDSVIISDYAKGVITKKVAKSIIKISNNLNKKVFVDPKGKEYKKYKDSYLITPNKKEAIEAINSMGYSNISNKKMSKILKKELNLNYGVITLSEEGIALLDNKKFEIIPTKAKEIYDVTGAGDTVISSICIAIESGANIKEALEFANYSAAVVISKIGSATASLEEIDEYITSIHKGFANSHIKDFKEIELISKKAKKNGKKVVFTNGCFDILHKGHVKYLEVAKSFGDILILGLNSNSSVKRLKGEDRPINTEEDRAYILSALESVDYVVIFDEDTPLNLIKLIKPHTLVKGGDYRGKDVVGSTIADELKLVDFVDGKSTTKTIEKIKGSTCKI